MTTKQPTPKAAQAEQDLRDLANDARFDQARRIEGHDPAIWRPDRIDRTPYPATVSESLRPNYRFKRGVLRATRLLKKAQPYRGSLSRRVTLLRAWAAIVAPLHSLQIPAIHNNLRDGAGPGESGGSHYSLRGHDITLVGRLSLVTFFHEFAHALGRDEPDACRWSLNLFRRVFPKMFADLSHDGHAVY